MAAGWRVENNRVPHRLLNSTSEFQPANAGKGQFINETSAKNGILVVDKSKKFLKGYVLWNTENWVAPE
jgi:hypothetical protein